MTMVEKQLAALEKELEKIEKTLGRAIVKAEKMAAIADKVGMKITLVEWCSVRDTATQEQYFAHFNYFSATEEVKDAEGRRDRLTRRIEKMQADQMGKIDRIGKLLGEYSIPAIDQFLDNWEENTLIFYQVQGKMTENTAKDLKIEKQNKKLAIIYKVKNRIGTVTDGQGLYIANDGNINGVIIGDKGRATITTILAGGYNIQCLHYRVLVD